MVELTKEEKKQLKQTLFIFRVLAPKTQEIKGLIKKIENTKDKDENIKLVKELQVMVGEANEKRILKYAEAKNIKA